METDKVWRLHCRGGHNPMPARFCTGYLHFERRYSHIIDSDWLKYLILGGGCRRHRLWYGSCYAGIAGPTYNSSTYGLFSDRIVDINGSSLWSINAYRIINTCLSRLGSAL